MPRIEITDAAQSREVPVMVGAVRMRLPVLKPVEVPEAVCEVLDHSSVVYRRLDGGQPAYSPPLHLLDQSVDKIEAALSDLTDADLAALKAAEEDGKTRKSAIAALDDEIARRKETP
jgi:hypothetical protein